MLEFIEIVCRTNPGATDQLRDGRQFVELAAAGNVLVKLSVILNTARSCRRQRRWGLPPRYASFAICL
jgi:hypothetical protein